MRHIMAVYDGSPCSYCSVLLAAGLASTNEARLHVLSVVPLPKFGLDIATDAAILASVETCEHLLDSLRTDLTQRGLQFRMTLKCGNLVDETVQYALEYGVGLIVVGCSFRSLFSRWSAHALLKRLVRLAPCPVTMVNESSTPGNTFGASQTRRTQRTSASQ
jgi:nucleotide-binding universal stress UspA family protein